MNIKVNDICTYIGTNKTCLILAILGDNAWVKATDLESEDNDYNGHVIPLEDWNNSEGKYVVEDSYGTISTSYSVKDYRFIALPTIRDVTTFRELFSDEDIMKVLRRPQ